MCKIYIDNEVQYGTIAEVTPQRVVGLNLISDVYGDIGPYIPRNWARLTELTEKEFFEHGGVKLIYKSEPTSTDEWLKNYESEDE